MNVRLVRNWCVASLVALVLMFPLMGLFGPKPGAPIGQRSLDIGPVWLTRITERTNDSVGVSQATWRVEGNWPAIVGCAALLGLVTVGTARVLRHDSGRRATAA
jgi:hypothetical protein